MSDRETQALTDMADVVSSQRRLQRPPDFTGTPLNHFRDVFLRHGLPGLLLGCLFLFPAIGLLDDQVNRFLETPVRYLGGGICIFVLTIAWSWYLDRNLSAPQLGWIVYLLLLSAWEEWVFRVALPDMLLGSGVPLGAAIIFSNLLFGAMHYFTLRWKIGWCVLAFFGGMGLSRQYINGGDLLLVIGIHWIATFLNTPGPPRPKSDLV